MMPEEPAPMMQTWGLPAALVWLVGGEDIGVSLGPGQQWVAT